MEQLSMSENIVEKCLREAIEVKSAIITDKKLLRQVTMLAETCVKSLRGGGKIIFCGNGGSFADAQHLSAELTSRFLFDRPGLASIALATNNSSLTAIGNDYGYENVFAREIESIANEVDILIAITTSGKSENILKALDAAKNKGIHAFVFMGRGPGKLPNYCEVLNMPSEHTPRIQECHILIGHILCQIIEDKIFGGNNNEC
jgi:D-sedoheptulose 7-phosphate isomerase